MKSFFNKPGVKSFINVGKKLVKEAAKSKAMDVGVAQIKGNGKIRLRTLFYVLSKRLHYSIVPSYIHLFFLLIKMFSRKWERKERQRVMMMVRQVLKKIRIESLFK